MNIIPYAVILKIISVINAYIILYSKFSLFPSLTVLIYMNIMTLNNIRKVIINLKTICSIIIRAIIGIKRNIKTTLFRNIKYLSLS